METRDGAGGVIGVDLVAHSPPDGYNFVITTLSLTAINPLINSKIGYDPFKDLSHVAYLAGSPIVFIVSAKSDVKTLADFVAKAKVSAKPLTYGVSGFASAGQMVTESFAQEAGLKFQVVPYKGAAQSQLDVVAGNIDFATPTVTSAAAQLQGGTVIALAQTGSVRLPDYPNVPTFKELGYKLDATNWFGLAGPAGLPDDVTQKVNRAINAGMALPAKPGSHPQGRHDRRADGRRHLQGFRRARGVALEAGDPQSRAGRWNRRCASFFCEFERSGLSFLFARIFQRVAGLVQQIRNIDPGQRIGALDDQNIARCHAAQRLPGAQRRQRAFEAAQVDGFFRHFSRVV